MSSLNSKINRTKKVKLWNKKNDSNLRSRIACPQKHRSSWAFVYRSQYWRAENDVEFIWYLQRTSCTSRRSKHRQRSQVNRALLVNEMILLLYNSLFEMNVSNVTDTCLMFIPFNISTHYDLLLKYKLIPLYEETKAKHIVATDERLRFCALRPINWLLSRRNYASTWYFNDRCGQWETCMTFAEVWCRFNLS